MAKCASCLSDNAAGAVRCLECGQPLALEIHPGFILASRYEIRETLGKGGMGVVYEAHDSLLNEQVAIKVLRPDVVETREITQRFIAEIKLARSVSHKNVCRIHEYGEDRGIRYISMAFVDGPDVKRILRERSLTVEEAYEVSIRTAEGLHAIHEEGIVHRDLKTANITIDSKGVVRLMDFGIAKQHGGVEGMTQTGQIIGTPEYMSPEQVQGHQIDSRSDIYSLGIVTFELFTGATPFRANTPIATMFKHIQEAPPLEGPAAARLPPPVVPILRQALAKDRRARFADARELARALEAARAQTRASAAPTVVPSQPETEAARQPARRPVAETVPRRSFAANGAAPTDALPAPARPARARQPIRPVGSRGRKAVAMGVGLVLAALGAFLWQRPASPAVSEPRVGTTLPPTPARSVPISEEVVLSPAAIPPKAVSTLPTAPAPRAQATPIGLLSAAPSRDRPQTALEPSPPVTPPPRAPNPLAPLLADAEKALEAANYDAAVKLYDEALKVDPQDAIARMGRATAVNARVTAQAMTGPRPLGGKAFVAGLTSSESPDAKDSGLAGFESAGGLDVTRDTQAVSLPGRIQFSTEPATVKAGDRFALSISLLNSGRAPIDIKEMLVTTSVNGKRSSGAVPILAKSVGPGQTGLLLSLSDFMRDDARSFVLEVVVRTTSGAIYKNDLVWK